jgi:uncharacterized protein
MPSKCFSCKQLCCKYITVKIETPKSIIDFDALYWWLLHDKVHVFKDSSGWYLIIYNECRYMKDGKCGNYKKRPFTCREHSEEFCQFDDDIKNTVDLYIKNIKELDKYCTKRFKSWPKRFDKL